jgi:transposase
MIIGADAEKKTLRAKEQDRPDVLAAREAWKRCQPELPAERLVFGDESSAKTNMTRLYGWSLAGKRCVCGAPHGHWGTRTMISSMRLDGTTACAAVDGATDTEFLLEYARTTLIPSLHPGDIVVLDNLAPHRSPRLARMLAEAGVLLILLPPYSPDLNPIEPMWGKVKTSLRRDEPRTSDELDNAIGKALEDITPQNAASWFAHCGYIIN